MGCGKVPLRLKKRTCYGRHLGRPARQAAIFSVSMLWQLRRCVFVAPRAAARLHSSGPAAASLDAAVSEFNAEMSAVFGSQQPLQPQQHPDDSPGSLQDAYRLTQELHTQQAGLAPRRALDEQPPFSPPPPAAQHTLHQQGRAITIVINVPPGQGSTPLHVSLSLTLRAE